VPSGTSAFSLSKRKSRFTIYDVVNFSPETGQANLVVLSDFRVDSSTGSVLLLAISDLIIVMVWMLLTK